MNPSPLGRSAITRRPDWPWVALGLSGGQRPARRSTTDGGWALSLVQVFSFWFSWQFCWVWLEGCGMSTSEGAPLESRDVETLKALAGMSFPSGAYLSLPSGRVLDADEATALCGVYAAAAPNIPIRDGNGVNRWLCHHGRSGKECPRCKEADTAVFVNGIPEWHPDRDQSSRGLGVLLLLVTIAIVAGLGIWYVISSWPK